MCVYFIPFMCAYVHACMCASGTVDGWWRRGIPQPGWRSHTVHWLDPAGGVLPAKPRGAALQAQTPLCPDRPVNEGPQRPPRAHMHLNSGAFLDKHSQCSCALKKKDTQTNWTAMLTETTVIAHRRPHCGARPLVIFLLEKKLNLTIDCRITDYMCWRWCAVLSGECHSLAL